MIANSCSTLACSAFGELRNGSEWYGHNLLSLGKNVRKISYGTGPRKYDFVTGAHKPFNMLGSSQEINSTLPNADLSLSVIGNEYWQHDSSVMDDGLTSQTVHERDKTPALILCPREGGDIELPPENCSRDVRSVKYDDSSELSTRFAYNQTGQENFQHHSAAGSGSVEIKVEVDPNLYVNCDTPVDKSKSDCHLKNSQCNKPSIVLLPKTHSKVNSNRNVCASDSGTKNVDILNKRLNVGKKQGEIAESNELKQFVEDELDNKQKSVNSDDSEGEASELSEGDSGFCTGAPMVEESSDSYDFVRNCNSEEQMDLQLSRFYKFECYECAVKQTFTTFKLLDQHCKDEHQSRGCILCCDQTMWKRDELVAHMWDHKHAYRWDK
jgi:hypothetical protein